MNKVVVAAILFMTFQAGSIADPSAESQPTSGSQEITFKAFSSPDEVIPVAFSVPFASGAVSSLEEVGLTTSGERPPQQWRVLSRWPDSSIRWAEVLAPLKGDPVISLNAARVEGADAFEVNDEGDHYQLTSGAVSLAIDRERGVATLVSGERQLSFVLSEVLGPDKELLEPKVDSIELFESGPVRAVLRVQGWHVGKSGKRLFRFDHFLTLYAGLPMVGIDHALAIISGVPEVNLKQEMFAFDSARIPVRFPKAQRVTSAEAVKGDSEVALRPGDEIFQFEDNEFALTSEGESEVTVGRLAGLFTAETGEGTAFVAIEDFWQQYPKALTVREDGVDIGLYPELKVSGKNPYTSRENEHVHYFYLRKGHYEMRQGVKKSHRLMLGWKEGALASTKAIAARLERPVVLPPLDYLRQTNVVGEIVPPGSGGLFDLWDDAFRSGARFYFAQQEEGRWYGLMNWGDWHGERIYNWGNHEYDLPATFFRQGLRLSDPALVREAIRGATHRLEIDVVNQHGDASQVGRNWTHSLGHTGLYYEPGTLSLPNYGGSDAAFHTGKSTPGHTRVPGVFLSYLLTGDQRALETGRRMADHLLLQQVVQNPNFRWSTAREPGWTLVNLTAAYQATTAPEYLQGANRVADIVLNHADGQGVWHKPLAGGKRNSPGPVPELGELSFPTAFQAAGMIELYKLTGREDIRENIIATASYIIERLYRPEHKAFVHSPSRIRRQTPRAGGIAGTNLRYVLAYAYELSKDEELLDPIRKTFAVTAANRHWCGAKGDPDRPSPQEFSGSFYFMNEDQSVMGKILGDWMHEPGDYRRLGAIDPETLQLKPLPTK